MIIVQKYENTIRIRLAFRVFGKLQLPEAQYIETSPIEYWI